MIDGSDLMGMFLAGNNTFAILFYVALVIGQWKIFEKAGEEGWKSLIPFYNAYILWKIAGRNFIELVVATVIVVVLSIVLGSIAAATSSEILGIIAGLLYLIYLIYLIIVTCKFCDGLSKAFGHGGAFATGLFFMQPIFLMILGFNKDEYQKVGKTENVETISENQQQ